MLFAREELFEKGAKFEDPVKRIAYLCCTIMSVGNAAKLRKKKPFNPMLGETYELVTEDYRFISEQVSHHPPISAYFQEGKGYKTWGFAD